MIFPIFSRGLPLHTVYNIFNKYGVLPSKYAKERKLRFFHKQRKKK